jgi:hypothetical protein
VPVLQISASNGKSLPSGRSLPQSVQQALRRSTADCAAGLSGESPRFMQSANSAAISAILFSGAPLCGSKYGLYSSMNNTSLKEKYRGNPRYSIFRIWIGYSFIFPEQSVSTLFFPSTENFFQKVSHLKNFSYFSFGLPEDLGC